MKIQTFKDRVDGKDNAISIDANGLEILSDDGKTLYRLTLADGNLTVIAGGFCVHENRQLDETIMVQPLSTNKISIERKTYISSELERTNT